MLRNYLLVAFRNLRRNKVFSVINIAGLAIGLTTCLLIMVYVLDETSYDRSFNDLDRLYRVALQGRTKGWACAPAPMADGLKAEMPEVEQSTRLLKISETGHLVISYQQNGKDLHFIETNAYFVDSTFFRVLSYPFTAGDPATALDQANTVVISATVAGKLFGSGDPMGRSIKLDGTSYTVSGVFQDKDLHTHIPAHLFMSMNSSDLPWVREAHGWAMQNIFHTYVKLRPGTDPVAFEKKLTPYLYRHGGQELKAKGGGETILLQPVKDIYLHSAIGNEIAVNGSIRTLIVLLSIAIFILVIACINFMNLSTARSEHRAREVGVRKVMGAMRGSLVRQFLSESFLLCLIALALAVFLTWITLPVFDALTQKELKPWHEPRLIGLIVTLTIFAGLLSGCYPAFYLSSFKPVTVLKGKLVHHFSAALLRKSLVVFQFTISIGLILGAVVIGRQMSLLRDQDLGFDKDRQIVLPLQTEEAATNYDVLHNELKKNAGVRSVTSGSTYPGVANLVDMLFTTTERPEKVDVHLYSVNDDYFQTLGLRLVSGRMTSPRYAGDTGNIVLNETAVRQFGYNPATAVGRRIVYQWQGVDHPFKIIGIVGDFNFESLHNPIGAMGFSTDAFFGSRYSYLIAKIQTADLSSVITAMHKAWDKVNPSTPFSYSFLDQDFARNYEKEQRTSTLVSYFTGIAILIACLGLFGLTAFAAEQRIKEIGIRKVLGASATNVTLLLSGDLIKLVGIAILIASPVAGYLMEKWLNNFSYRIHLSWWMFAIAAAGAIFTAIVTVSFQAIKAARANPVHNLRSE